MATYSYPFPSLPSCGRHNYRENFESSTTFTSVPTSWYLTDVTIYTSRLLGKGSYGTVCLGEWLGSTIAIKKLHEVCFSACSSKEEKSKVLKTFTREVNTLFQLNHPNIVSFYGIYNNTGHESLLNISDICLVYELLCSSLNTRNRHQPQLTYRNIIDVSIGMTGGLRYLHERPVPIIHKDLASKNILLSLNGTPKIADLGIIDIINSTNDYPNDENAQPLTNVYTEPEAFLQGAVCDYSTDIYSLGVIILEVSIGRDPTAIEAFRVTSSNDVQLVPELERRSIDLQDVSDSPLHCLIVACLTRKEDRPDALSLYEKLKELQSELLYVNSPDVPLMETSSTKRNELEDKLLLLKAEKESLKSQLNEHHGKNDFSSDVRRLEATIRSRDSEIAALRSRNISLEEKLDDCQRSKESLSSCNQMPSVRLTARGSPSNESITADNSAAIELKQLKKQLEKYKDLTIELDSKLKDAQSELSKYSTRQTSMDIQAQYDINALRAENRLLRSDLERSRRDALHYHSAYSRGFNTSRY